MKEFKISLYATGTNNPTAAFMSGPVKIPVAVLYEMASDAAAGQNVKINPATGEQHVELRCSLWKGNGGYRVNAKGDQVRDNDAYGSFETPRERAAYLASRQQAQPPAAAPAPAYGQPPAPAPAYGQPPAAAPAYGQPPAAAPAYGQPPAAAPPPAYGQPPAAAPAYGQPPAGSPAPAAAPAYGQPPAPAPAAGGWPFGAGGWNSQVPI